MTKNQILLRSDDAAKFLQISDRTLRTLCATGKLKSYQPNGRIRYFLIEDLMSYVKGGAE